MIHTTVGVYFGGTHKRNGVPTERLAGHIEYNKLHRPGRALFVDGECVYEGYLTPDMMQKAQKIIETQVPLTTDTAPYQ